MVGNREEVRRKGGVIGPRPSEEDAQGRTLAIAFARWSGRFRLADEHGHETRSQDEVFSANQCTNCRRQIGEFATPAQKICKSAPLGGRNLADSLRLVQWDGATVPHGRGTWGCTASMLPGDGCAIGPPRRWSSPRHCAGLLAPVDQAAAQVVGNWTFTKAASPRPIRLQAR